MTLGILLALHVTLADEHPRAQVARQAEKAQQVARDQIEVAFVDQWYTWEQASVDAAKDGIVQNLVKHVER